MIRLLLPVSLTFLLIACGGGGGGGANDTTEEDLGAVGATQNPSQATTENPEMTGGVTNMPSESTSQETPVATGISMIPNIGPSDEMTDPPSTEAPVATAIEELGSPPETEVMESPSGLFSTEAPVAASIVQIASESEQGLAVDNPSSLITSARADDAQGIFFTGLPPAATGNIPVTSPSEATETIISGGSLSLNIGTLNPFVVLYVSSDTDGYYRIDLPQETSQASLFLTLSSIQLDGDSALISVQVERLDGSVSDPLIFPVTSRAVGTGELQVSVNWDQPVDMDLVLQEPDETVIFFGNEVSPSGGMLDLDSNPGCFIDGVNNENITYDGASPPSGTYLVFVVLFSACDVLEPINFVVTVRANGSVQIFNGTLTAADESQAIDITQFTIP